MATLRSPHRSPVLDDNEANEAATAMSVYNTGFQREHGHERSGDLGRPSSIDMALRLEHELDAEHEELGHADGDGRTQTSTPLEDVSLDDAEDSPSSRSAGAITGIGPTNSRANATNLDSNANGSSRPVSLDPLVLAGIVANLRADLARVTQERDALTDTLNNAPGKEAELREALALLTERCQELEREVERLRRKSQDDDDAIQMLRSKVEESRYVHSPTPSAAWRIMRK